MNKQLLALIVLSGSIPLVACGESGERSDVSVSQASAQESDATDSAGGGRDGTTSSTSDAADIYLGIVTPVNCIGKQLSQAANTYGLGDGKIDLNGIRQLQPILAQAAKARSQAAAYLSEETWPGPIEVTVREMAQYWFGVAKIEEALSLASDVGEWELVIGKYNAALSDPEKGGLSSMIRSILGLPNNDEDYVNSLEC